MQLVAIDRLVALFENENDEEDEDGDEEEY